MHKAPSLSVLRPLALIAGAAIVAAAVAVLSLGLLMPLSVLLLSLGIFLAGFWFLLNKRTAGSQTLGILLILGSIALGAGYVLRSVGGHG